MPRIVARWIRSKHPLPAAVAELASEVIRQGLGVIFSLLNFGLRFGKSRAIKLTRDTCDWVVER